MTSIFRGPFVYLHTMEFLCFWTYKKDLNFSIKKKGSKLA